MATVRDLIRGSLRLIGAVASSENVTASEQADALYALNSMIEVWSTQNLFIVAKIKEEFPLTAGKQTYTIGTGGDFATTRPIKLEHAAIRDPNAPVLFETPLDILNPDEWASITVKGATTALPLNIYNDQAYPLSNISLWPIPSVAKNLILVSTKPLAKFADANATVDLAPGYEEALRYNLAIRLCPEYGKTATPEVVNFATEAIENIKRVNVRTPVLTCDAAVLGGGRGFNIVTGD